jgi:hypothetical protein
VSYIPDESAALRGLAQVNQDLVLARLSEKSAAVSSCNPLHMGGWRSLSDR